MHNFSQQIQIDNCLNRRRNSIMQMILSSLVLFTAILMDENFRESHAFWHRQAAIAAERSECFDIYHLSLWIIDV